MHTVFVFYFINKIPLENQFLETLENGKDTIL